jgi:hypothetical protein
MTPSTCSPSTQRETLVRSFSGSTAIVRVDPAPSAKKLDFVALGKRSPL